MKEYKMAKGWLILMYILTPLLILLFGGGFIALLLADDIEIEMLYILEPIFLAMAILFTLALMDCIKGKVIITGDTLSIRGVFINRDLLFEEIKGYKIEEKHITVVSNTTTKKHIKITKYIGEIDELTAWLSANFVDLHLENQMKEEKEILDNYEYGRNEDERTFRLKQAKRTAKLLNLAGGIVLVWTLFIPNPYEYAIIASITMPLISVLAVIFFKGLIRIDEKKGSAYPSIFFAILMTSIGLMLRALLDFNIHSYSNVWLPVFLIALSLILIIIIGSKEIRFRSIKEFGTAISLFLFFFAYGYGAIVTTNCYFDESKPINYKAEIISKHISSGKTTTYYIELTPWGDQTESEDISVSESFYDRMEAGDSVNVYLREGMFEIPWIIVDK